MLGHENFENRKNKLGEVQSLLEYTEFPSHAFFSLVLRMLLVCVYICRRGDNIKMDLRRVWAGFIWLSIVGGLNMVMNIQVL
jgi:hypothetical protein